jgi:hypothetical protein
LRKRCNWVKKQERRTASLLRPLQNRRLPKRKATAKDPQSGNENVWKLSNCAINARKFSANLAASAQLLIYDESNKIQRQESVHRIMHLYSRHNR